MKENQKSESVQRPSSASSSTSNNSRVNHHSIDSKINNKKSEKASIKSETPLYSQNNNPEAAAIAALLAQSGLDPNTNMAALTQMMEQEKMMQEMMNLSQLAAAGGQGLPPGLDPAMLQALAQNPFLMGGAQNNFQAPQNPPSPQMSERNKSKQKSSRHVQRSPSPRERSVSPASSVASNISQQQNMQQPDIGMLMSSLMMGGGMPPPMGLGNLGIPGMPGDLSQLPPELLAALGAAAAGGGGNPAGGMPNIPGMDPNMFSALAQLSNLSNNAQNDQESSFSPNPNRTKNSQSKGNNSKSNMGNNNFSPMSNQRSGVGSKGPSTPSSSHRLSSSQQGGQSRGSSSNSRKSSRPERMRDDDEPYQGLDLSKSNTPSRSDRQQKSSSKNY